MTEKRPRRDELVWGRRHPTADPCRRTAAEREFAPERLEPASRRPGGRGFSGHELLVADSAAAGLKLLETRFPDLALVDLGLPDASGFEVLRRVRQADGVASRVDPATPLVLLTGRDGELDRVRGFERGADDYICKPFSYPELRGRVAALLRRTRRRG